jgi:hypothetical protein
MRRVVRLSVVLAIISWLALDSLQASVLRFMSLAELTAEADRIVIAKVVATEAAWDPAHRKIFSTTTVDIEETWKGSGSNRLRIVQPGGSVGDIEMTVYGMPRFAPGERSLLFLRGADQFQVVGMAQGKRDLRWSAASHQWWVDSADATDTLVLDREGKARRTSSDAHAALDDLRRQVKEQVKEIVERK